MANQHFVITISHQLGSGGSQLGLKLSERLDVPFVDRDILKKVAEQLHLAEAVLDGRDERLTSFWQSFFRVAAFANPVDCLSLDNYMPTDLELFTLESQYIGRIADKSSAIFLGRCGRYILRNHPGHFSILVHANLPDRVRRVQELYCLEEDQARKLIVNNDRERANYVRTFTRQDWFDARWYNLCVNTSSFDLDEIVNLVLVGVKGKIKI